MDCAKPLVVKTRKGYVEVPCGNCILCRIARTREWSTRLQMENSCWNESVFLTLTYDDDHVPYTNCGRLTLRKKDLQLFFKRLRESLYRDLVASNPSLPSSVLRSRVKLKYFACGEYGDHTFRPHYHAIVFGVGPSKLALFQSLWPFGFVSVGGVSPESIRYVTGYVRKKLVKLSSSPDDCCLRSFPSFQIQSQGLGLAFYDNFKDVIRKRCSVRIAGHNESIPRYFLKKDTGLKLALELSQDKYNSRIHNLKDAQKVLDHRYGGSVDVFAQRLVSSQFREKTEKAKNNTFSKGSL